MQFGFRVSSSDRRLEIDFCVCVFLAKTKNFLKLVGWIPSETFLIALGSEMRKEREKEKGGGEGERERKEEEKKKRE